MKVLLVANEFFSWGIYGGWGAFTRKLGKELVKAGVEVEAIVHKKISSNQKGVGEIEVIDGVPVKTLPRRKPQKLWRKALYKTTADIIHSQCGMFDTYLMFKRNEEKKKIVTVQDLRTKEEHARLKSITGINGYPWYKKLWERYVCSCYSKAMKDADVVACQARLLFPKVKEIYGIEPSLMLPNFIDIPKDNFKKSKEPMVVWLGRLDSIKQPELCFEFAMKTPDVDFHILGDAHDKSRDIYLKKKYGNIKNLHFLGFQSGEMKEEMLSKAWILINTSAYECLPVSFLEALAHKCAILSTRNPDNYTECFGNYARPNVHSLKECLENLLRNDLWKRRGEKGYEYVKNYHSTEAGVRKHIETYRDLLA